MTLLGCACLCVWALSSSYLRTQSDEDTQQEHPLPSWEASKTHCPTGIYTIEINIPLHLVFCIEIFENIFVQSASVWLTDSNPVIVKQSSSQTWFCWPSDNPVRKQLVTRIESELTLTCSMHVAVAIDDFDVDCIQLTLTRHARETSAIQSSWGIA